MFENRLVEIDEFMGDEEISFKIDYALANKRLLSSMSSNLKTEISSLRREKNETKEVKVGQECGIGLLDFEGFEEGDMFECYLLENIEKK